MPWIYKLVGVFLLFLAFALAGQVGLACGLAVAGGLCLLGAAILECATAAATGTPPGRSRS